MSKPDSQSTISPEEIREVYAQGEDAVVALVTMLIKRVETLEQQVEELTGKLSKNSRNSNKPPSSDGFKPKPKSLRRKSEKKSGGQPKHHGSTLEWSEQVSRIHEHQVSECWQCGTSLSSEPVTDVLMRQVFDIPPISLEVSEHRAEVKCCPICGQQNSGQFPCDAKTLVQYGPRLKAMMVYLMEAQLLPSSRTVELLKELFSIEISEGSLYNNRQHCFEQLESISKSIHDALLSAPVVHFDETGMRVNQKLWWLHVASTAHLTDYFIHPKRGRAAMDEMSILPSFSGKAVHDGLKSYAGYECEHFLCNAHHLRELQFMFEHHQQMWAYQMSLLLVSIQSLVKTRKQQGETELTSEQRREFEARYQSILAQGFKSNPPSIPPPGAAKKRGRVKQSPPFNLLERLRKQQASVLGFMYDFSVPFDNNQAERDLRMMKLKQKISGCFRSKNGAKMFCRIRGYLSTVRKQGLPMIDALIGLFSGNPISINLQPE